MAQKQGKGGGSKKIGRNKTKCERYRREFRREKSKLSKIARSNGLQAALTYGQKYSVLSFAHRAVAERTAYLMRRPGKVAALTG